MFLISVISNIHKKIEKNVEMFYCVDLSKNVLPV